MRAQIGFIGTGVMGQAVIATLIKAGVDKDQISFTRKHSEKNDEIVASFGIHPKGLRELVEGSNLIFLAIKPQDLIALLEEMRAFLSPRTLIVSLVAGKSTRVIEESLQGPGEDALNQKIAVIRVMPNTPMVVGEGLSAISRGKHVRDEDLEWVREKLSFGGRAIVIDETLQDAVTTMSGSGPAYFFAFVEAMVRSGERLGISHDDATMLAISTIKGAAVMLERSGKSPTTLRENVTSPNGVTAEALKVFKEHGLDEMVEAAMRAARDRSVELG